MKLIFASKWLYKFTRILYFLRHGWNKLLGHGLQLKDTFSEFHKDMWINAASNLSVELTIYSGGFYRAKYKKMSTWISDYLVEIDNCSVLQVARNKPLVNHILLANNISAPPFQSFTINSIDSAEEFLKSQEGPCVIKPALDSAGGKGVTTHIQTVKELKRAAIFASAFSPEILIEKQIEGDVYRLLFLDGHLIDAIRRDPPRVVGDGKSTIRELIKQENKKRIEQSGHLSLKVLVIDFDCKMTLRRNGFSLKSIPDQGQVVSLKTTTNESGANECESVFGFINEEIIKECRNASEIIGIKLAGVDIITPDIESPLKSSGGKIIEINASPGLHYHYQVRNIEDSRPVAENLLRYLLKIEEGA